MDDNYVRPCFDSSLFIAALDKEICGGIKRDIVFHHIWEKAKDGDFQVFISAITIAEVYKRKTRPTALSEHSLDEFLELINEPFVEVIEIDRETALNAHALCRRFAAEKLQPVDAMILACALRAKCDTLLAWDNPLVAVHHETIRIEQPQMIGRMLHTPSEQATEQEIKDYEKTRQAIKSASTGIPRSGSGHSEG